MRPPDAPIDIVVLTGFLGSGKTTLLADFLATPAAADTGVIVNEAGEIGLDGAILAETGSGVPMAMLANGCICCRMGSDLSATIEALLAAARPGAEGPLRRIVLETSGLSKPGPILRQLADLAGLSPRVTVVATYDAVRGAETADFEEAAAQWAGAHRIVVTKLDAVSAARAAVAVEEARGVAPLAEMVAEGDRAALVAGAFAALAVAGPSGAPLSRFTAGHSRITVRLLRPLGRPQHDELAAWIDNLAGALGERLLRLKGLVRVAELDRPLLVQSVGTLFSAPRPIAVPVGAEGSWIVVIARDTAPGEIEATPPRGLFAA